MAASARMSSVLCRVVVSRKYVSASATLALLAAAAGPKLVAPLSQRLQAEVLSAGTTWKQRTSSQYSSETWTASDTVSGASTSKPHGSTMVGSLTAKLPSSFTTVVASSSVAAQSTPDPKLASTS